MARESSLSEGSRPCRNEYSRSSLFRRTDWRTFQLLAFAAQPGLVLTRSVGRLGFPIVFLGFRPCSVTRLEVAKIFQQPGFFRRLLERAFKNSPRLAGLV